MNALRPQFTTIEEDVFLSAVQSGAAGVDPGELAALIERRAAAQRRVAAAKAATAAYRASSGGDVGSNGDLTGQLVGAERHLRNCEVRISNLLHPNDHQQEEEIG